MSGPVIRREGRHRILLAIVLANGEGLPVRLDDNVSELARRLVLYARAERLRRAGQLRFDPRTLSLETLAIAGLRTEV